MGAKRKDVSTLRHVILHTLGDRAAGVEQCDAYIYECFRAFANSKLDVVLDYRYLMKAPFYLSELVVPCLVHADEYSEKDEVKGNIPTPRLLRLFPNLRTLDIQCGIKKWNYNHTVSISHLCATFPELALLEHEHIRLRTRHVQPGASGAGRAGGKGHERVCGTRKRCDVFLSSITSL